MVQDGGQAVLGAHLQRLGALVDQVPHQNHGIAAMAVLAPAAVHAQPQAGHLDEVLRQMDAASLKFQSAEANFRWDLYDHLVKETTTQTGTIFFKK